MKALSKRTKQLQFWAGATDVFLLSFIAHQKQPSSNKSMENKSAGGDGRGQDLAGGQDTQKKFVWIFFLR